MQYLASKGFVHKDLAARNIFVTNNDTCKVVSTRTCGHKDLTNILLLCRLVKFGSQKNCPVLEMMFCLIRYLSNQQLPRLCTTTSTPLPVMSGAMAACSTRSGALDAHPSRHSQTKRSVLLNSQLLWFYVTDVFRSLKNWTLVTACHHHLVVLGLFINS